MKSVKFVIVAALLSTVSLASAAAQQPEAAPYYQTAAAAVNVSGSSSLISLEQQLSGKQDNIRVKPFRIASTSSASRLSGTAASLN
ncbi:multiple stress resistance protein BhsA [Pantoea sp. RRHST58]|uniref:multiple stress resistance protein BhsA n=1 Tax=Pantoea sp. RRHST58 TaxID=3425183 RepID=UPI003DA01292